MSTGKQYWLNNELITQHLQDHFPTFKGTGWEELEPEGALFLFDERPAEELASVFRDDQGLSHHTCTDMISQGRFPLGFRSKPLIHIEGGGDLCLKWSESQGELLYPLFLQGDKVKSFAVILCDFEGFEGSNERRNIRPYIFFCGSVGGQGSGADLELEALNKYEEGAPLYLPDNKLRLPFNIYRGHIDKSDTPQVISFNGTNGLTQTSYTGLNRQGRSHLSRPPALTEFSDAFDTSSSVWLSETVNDNYIEVQFKQVQREVTGVFVKGQSGGRSPVEVVLSYVGLDNVWREVHRFNGANDALGIMVELPEPIQGVKRIRLTCSGVYSSEAWRTRHGIVIRGSILSINEIRLFGRI
ncbi:hypothetical protein CWB96_00095 [Pseudoalteromonas citrea]|uniref:Uncharacterized protein n=1 Tax=Pseudoalteromonas citrea TaxID=43655 RepID=A0A5S3XX58_9GAMM|nr:hypothetical protein [Pseudoalteromonas citrea]TMP46266.1 hypothetical protein CWB97_02090 [Pseudoalteromonas citrea]TMP63042.1 hypothetical protein CWB96_00095 [Pseudoalteromonas citrea]